MAKSKGSTPKTKKPKSSKYTKLLAHASKELAGKKKSLVQAERTLAKARKRHEDLIAEVARLDMVERSLKALIDGTEPPQNIKYTYNYPVWVYPQPYPWIQYVYHYHYDGKTGQYNGYWGQYNTPNWTTSGGTIYNGATCTTPAINTIGTNSISLNANCGSLGVASGGSLSNFVGASSSGFMQCNNASSAVPVNSGSTLSFTADSAPYSISNTLALPAAQGNELIVDLSTGAVEDDKAILATDETATAVSV